MAELSVLICTLNDRIKTVPRILLPECEELHYVVSFQYTDNMFLSMIPDELRERKDVTLQAILDVGLSANRNNALRNCTTPLAVISDDDTDFSRQLYDDIIAQFHSDPKLDIVVFADTRLAFRISERIPQFDTRFGLGSAYLSCGEEEVLLHQAKIFGLKVRNVDFASYKSNRSLWSQIEVDQRVRRSWGALQYMKHTTVVSFLRIVSKSITFNLKSGRHFAPAERWHIFRDMFDGLRYIVTHPLNESVAEEIPLDFQPIDIWKMP